MRIEEMSREKKRLVKGLLLVLSGLLLAGSVGGATGTFFIEAVYHNEGLVGPITLTISPDGRHLYVGNEETSTAVTVFERDKATGGLSFVEVHIDGQQGVEGVDGAGSIAVSPDGRHLYVAGDYEDAVALFSRAEATGRLRFIEAYRDDQNGGDRLSFVLSIVVSPDGRHVYASSYSEDAVVAFDRNETTGRLSLIEVYPDQQKGVSGLKGARSVTISPDGHHLYVTGVLDQGLAVFRRDKTTGRLNFVELHTDGQQDAAGLGWPFAATVSPDGRHLYVANGGSVKELGVFSRDEVTGRLSFIEVHRQGQNGVEGLVGSNTVVVSPDGRRLYVPSWDDNAAAVFSRNETTGRLRFVEVHKDEQQGVTGLDKASSLAVSPDGRHFYVTSRDDDAVAIFGVPAGDDKRDSLYLPLILKPPPLPDLIVDSLVVDEKRVTVVIENRGPGPVVAPFWVDVYVNPLHLPAGPNQEWHKLGAEAGLVWGVTGLPLVAGESLTLTMSSPTLFPEQSSPLPLSIAPGSVVYAQVDSANTGVAAGAVVETDETNNIVGPVRVSSQTELARLPGGGVKGSDQDLPPRADRGAGIRND